MLIPALLSIPYFLTFAFFSLAWNCICASLLEWGRKWALRVCLLRKIVENCHNSFYKCWLDFTSEHSWAWCFLFSKVFEFRGRPGQMICFFLILMWFVCFSLISAVRNICLLYVALSVLLIFSKSLPLVFIDFYANFYYFFPLLLVTCSFSCLYFIYFFLEGSGEHLCHNTCREVTAQLEGVGSLLEPCGLWGLNSGHQVWLQSVPDELAVLLAQQLQFLIMETILSFQKHLYLIWNLFKFHLIFFLWLKKCNLQVYYLISNYGGFSFL